MSTPTDLPLFSQRPRPGAFALAGSAPTQHTSPAHSTPPQGAPSDDGQEPLPAPTSADAVGEDDQVAPDWSWVRQLRTEVTDQMTSRSLTTSPEDRVTVESLVTEAVENFNRSHISAGETPLSTSQKNALAEATLDAIYGAGRLQKLLDRDDLEDIAIRGADNVWLYYADGRVERGPAVAESDKDFVTDLQHLASTNPAGERAFNSANPRLDLALASGHRLSASMDFVRRPTCTIRFHRHVDVDLGDMVELGSIDETLRQFLTAAIRAGVSVVVAGLPGSGKTTLIRALLNELPPTMPIATIETEFELHLDAPDMHHRHVNVWAAQARRGGEDGAGAIGLDDLIYDALRQSVDRIVVGEVRGHEVIPMFKAMSAGTGSVSTIHAGNAADTVRRLATCALEAGVTPEFAYSQVAANINLIVYQKVVDERALGGKKHRFVSEVLACEPSADKPDGVGLTPIFTPDETGRAVPTGQLPPFIEQMQLVGYDPAWLSSRNSSWPPIHLLSKGGPR